MVVTSGSAPIATSTPVNLAAGPLSPPPLTLTAGQGLHHEHPPAPAPTVKVTSYPAVLKGRSAASPPNPNLVPSGKIPPPVPPRGTGSSRTGRFPEEHRAFGTTTSTSSTSSRGDEAAIITRYRLHDSSSNLHHVLSDYSSISTSSTTAKISTTTNTISTTFTAATSTETDATTNAMHAHTSTFNTYNTIHCDGFHERTKCKRSLDFVQNRHTAGPDENDEFVSVERIDNTYFIRTSSYPFRPTRKIYDHLEKIKETQIDEISKKNTEIRNNIEKNRSAKPTIYLSGPSSPSNSMNYKMSRKDKKQSETYYERVKRKQKNLEVPNMIITSIPHGHQLKENVETVDILSHTRNKSAEKSIQLRLN